MKSLIVFFFSLSFFAVLTAGCKRERLVNDCEASTGPDAALNAPPSSHEGEWNVPVHLGPEVNSTSRELGASLSADGLSLYFNSDRPLGLLAFDIYVSHRSCIDCPWEPAQMIGPPISGPGIDGTPALSHDGHLLFFNSDRVGGLGGLDIYMSRRKNPNDDFGWEDPVNLGPLVNSALDDGSPTYVVTAAGTPAELYFGRGGATWVVPISHDGELLGPAVQLDLGGVTNSPSVRKDGRELVFWRATMGNTDIWISTRHNVNDSWSAPVNLGPPVNTVGGGEMEAALSADGNTLVFSGNMLRGSSLGFTDIWITTRIKKNQ